MMVGMPGFGRAALLLLLLQLAGGGAGLDLESVGQKIIKKLGKQQGWFGEIFLRLSECQPQIVLKHSNF